MAEKDASIRLRRAVQENNLFLVKRLIKRTDIRNPDPNTKRYTSLVWAALQGNEETFEFLLSEGHDDDELSKDTENNTILTILADAKPPAANLYRSVPVDYYSSGAVLRMARLYYDRYPYIRDWANSHGKTALHTAAMRGNEELVRMLLDIGADFDLADNEGNTPLHYASAWGHIPIVQLLIRRGCQYAARNNEGFDASDYAYSVSTRDTLQDTARAQFENNKRHRRQVFAQAAARGTEWPPEQDSRTARRTSARYRTPGGSGSYRLRSGSSSDARTNGNSDSDVDVPSMMAKQLSYSSATSPSHQPSQLPSAGSHGQQSNSASSTSGFSVPSPSFNRNLALNPSSVLSPIATRMLERDADAMEKYKLRNRSGSAGTSNTTSAEAPSSQNGSPVGSATTSDDILSFVNGSVAPRRLLRPSASAAQLRDNTSNSINGSSSLEMLRTRSGTNPRSPPADVTSFFSGAQNGSRPTVIHEASFPESEDDFRGPSEKYAQFQPPQQSKPLERKMSGGGGSGTTTSTTKSRLPFHLLSKPLPALDPQIGHRRGASTIS